MVEHRLGLLDDDIRLSFASAYTIVQKSSSVFNHA
jgi:hypothetical protein